MEIILIRHAQSKGNETNMVQGHIDNGLSDSGKMQAEKLSEFFNASDITGIYSSDLNRAIQTAEPLAKKLNLKIMLDPDLREAGFGIWEGMVYDEVKKKFPNEYTEWHKNYFVRPFWFESFESHQIRIIRAIQRILITHKNGKRPAIFTHGGSIKTQIGYFKKLCGEELALFNIKNCSFTMIKFNHSKNYEDGELIYYNKEVVF